MEKPILSKSTFIRGLQCLKSLYLYKNRYFLRDPLPKEQQIIFARGHKVGDLARSLFPGGINLQPKSHFQYAKALERTAQAIEQDVPVIYEAGFVFNGVIVFLDILVKAESGWIAYEVKSSLSVSETYKKDAALQYHVISNSGIQLEDMFIVHMNPDYQRENEVDIQKLFNQVSVLEYAREHGNWIAEKIVLAKEAVALKKSPDIPVGIHCTYPYPCDFQGHCWKNFKGITVLDIPALDRDKAFTLYLSGILTLDDIPDEHKLGPVVMAQVEAFRNKTEVISNGLKEILDSSKQPVGLLKFLTYRPAVPLFEGNQPYQHLPFAFSLYRQDANGFNESTYCYQGLEDPTDEFISHLLESIANIKTILVYQQSELLSGICEANEMQPFPDIFDLSDILWNGHYYHPSLKTDLSLKNISKILLKDEYQGTLLSDAVASNLFETIDNTHLPGKEGTIRQISDYCKRDAKKLTDFYRLLKQKT